MGKKRAGDFRPEESAIARFPRKRQRKGMPVQLIVRCGRGKLRNSLKKLRDASGGQ